MSLEMILAAGDGQRGSAHRRRHGLHGNSTVPGWLRPGSFVSVLFSCGTIVSVVSTSLVTRSGFLVREPLVTRGVYESNCFMLPMDSGAKRSRFSARSQRRAVQKQLSRRRRSLVGLGVVSEGKDSISFPDDTSCKDRVIDTSSLYLRQDRFLHQHRLELRKTCDSFAKSLMNLRKSLEAIEAPKRSKRSASGSTGSEQTGKSAKAINAFITLLEGAALDLQMADHAQAMIDGNLDNAELRERLCRTVVQALRLSADIDNFRLILKIVDAIVNYAVAFAEAAVGAGHTGRTQTALLEPRIFGEAIRALGRSSSNQSKIRRLWDRYMDLASHHFPSVDGLSSQTPCVVFSPPTTFELDSAVSALADRGRIRAAVDLAKFSPIELDAYTASTVFTILADSIPKSDSPPAAVQNLTHTLEASSMSPCWEWREVLDFLENRFSKSGRLNNHAYAAALKVNEKAAALYDGNLLSPNGEPFPKHDGADAAMTLFERMKNDGVLPDVVTCSSVMSALDKGLRWKEALSLLRAMENDTENANLPAPNAYTYSAAISACARGNQIGAALNIINRLRESKAQETSNENDEIVRPNTWIYNTFLAACVRSTSTRKRGKRRIAAALRLLDRMYVDSSQGMDTEPDTVTFNTVLATICKNPGKAMEAEVTVLRLLERMQQQKVSPDTTTYRHAIRACQSHPEMALQLVERAFRDENYSPNSASESVAITDAALFVCVEHGDVASIARVLQIAEKQGLRWTKLTIKHLIAAFSEHPTSKAVPTLMQALRRQPEATATLAKEYSIRVPPEAGSQLDAKHYSDAIVACLNRREVMDAESLLSFALESGIELTELSLERIVKGYSKLTAMEARRELKQHKRRPEEGQGGEQRPSVELAHAVLAMINSLSEPSSDLLASAATACSAAGLWNESRRLLRSLHRRLVTSVRAGVSNHTSNQMKLRDTIKGVHRSVMTDCARWSNATAATDFAKTIQALAKEVSNKNENEDGALDKGISGRLEKSLVESPQLDLGRDKLGMTGETWKLLVVAASRAKEWKLCIAALQYLQPYLEKCKPIVVNSNQSLSAEDLDRAYDQLAPALTATLNCFEKTRHFGWVMRVVDDWIAWSGRTPPTQAMSAACRVLALHGHGQEVFHLVSRVVDDSEAVKRDEAPRWKLEAEGSYESLVLTMAMIALHKNGLYDVSDDLYVKGVADGHLPWGVLDEGPAAPFKMDLHGMRIAVANSAVRVALLREIQKGYWNGRESGDDDSDEEFVWDRDVVIVTGRGKHSLKRLRPVLRPEVQRMLQEEFFPPLNTISIPGNVGALKIPAEDVKNWLTYQRQQKGIRLLAVAAILKDVTLRSEDDGGQILRDEEIATK